MSSRKRRDNREVPSDDIPDSPVDRRSRSSVSWLFVLLVAGSLVFYTSHNFHHQKSIRDDLESLKDAFVQEVTPSSEEFESGGPVEQKLDNVNIPQNINFAEETAETATLPFERTKRRLGHGAGKPSHLPVPQEAPLTPKNESTIGTGTPLHSGTKVDGKTSLAILQDSGRSDALWKIALGAAVPRGEENGAPRLSAFAKKRVGKARHDGKAWKAGEEGCPEKPQLLALPGGALRQGDHRLKRFHFVHPPKSGGTTFGQVVIAAACEVNSQFRSSLDCCVNPADWCADNCEPIPDCKAIYGCTLCDCHHLPRMHRMADATWSVTIIRHPMTRYISGYFYRAHSPNWDRFGLRPGYFMKNPTYPFVFSFDDYLEMPEYHNILVKMFARDKFPYFNASLSEDDFNLAQQRLSRFLVVGINEAYDASVQLLLSLTGVTTLRDDQIHLPATMTSTYSKDHEKFKADLRSDPALTSRIRKANAMDVRLFEWSVGVFCQKLCANQLGRFDKRGVCSPYC